MTRVVSWPRCRVIVSTTISLRENSITAPRVNEAQTLIEPIEHIGSVCGFTRHVRIAIDKFVRGIKENAIFSHVSIPVLGGELRHLVEVIVIDLYAFLY